MFILSETVWPWIPRVLVPVIYVKTLKNDCTSQYVQSVNTDQSWSSCITNLLVSGFFKYFLSYFLLQSNDFLKLIFLLCLFVIQCYMTAWLGFFLYASRSCSHTNQDVRGLGSYGFTSGQILLLILPCVMTSGNITTGLQRVLRLIWYT